MIKIWGRNTSSNVQKAMWAVGELKLEHTRIDIGGAFGMNKGKPPYLAMNPNGLVPTLEEEDGFLLWESNSRSCAISPASTTRPACWNRRTPSSARAPASGWIGNCRWWRRRSSAPSGGLIRTPPENATRPRSRPRRTRPLPPCRCSTRNWARPPTSPADAFSYGDIPVGVMCYRYRQLVPARPATPNLDRWYDAISKRKPFQDHVGSIPLS